MNILLSYYYTRKHLRELGWFSGVKQNGVDKIILDSGAFTAYQRGEKIDLEEYMLFVKNPPFPITHYINLDVIGDGQRSMENYKRMLREGLCPLPVFQRGDTVKTLEEYYETNPYVCIGGVAGTNGADAYIKKWEPFFKGRRRHWLGFSRINFVRRYHPTSYDSTEWGAAGRYGTIDVYDNGSVVRVERTDDRLRRFLLEFGEDSSLLKRQKAWHCSSANSTVSINTLVSAISYLKFASRLLKMLQVEYYFVCSGNITATGVATLLHAQKCLDKSTLSLEVSV